MKRSYSSCFKNVIEKEETLYSPIALDLTQKRYSSEEENTGWSALNGAAIDGIVKHLKLSRRWSRDGRSLRSLNRHWRDTITLHVTHLHPLPDRVIEDEDLDSLEKFSEATSVDFTAFLFQNRETVKKFHRHPKEPSTARFLKLLERLRRLPKLQELKTKWGWYIKARLKSNGEVEAVKNAMAKLTGVSRLVLNDGLIRCFTTEDLSIFSPLPIQEVSGWIKETESLSPVDLFPSLRKAQIVTRTVCEYFPRPYLAQLESLRLWTSNPKDFECLPDKRVLEGLKMPIIDGRGADSFLELTHLKDLSLFYFDGRYYTEPPTVRIMLGDTLSAIQPLHRLENFNLDTSYDFYPVPQEMWNSFFEGVPGLKSLSLSCVCCDGAAILKHLQNLEILKLRECDVLDSERFFSFADLQGSLECKTLQRIRKLEVLDRKICRNQPLVYHWSLFELSKMSRLESFTYSPPSEFPIECLKELALCRTLRSLAIKNQVAWNSTGRDVLLSLSHLEVIKLRFETLELCHIEDIERTLAELKTENPWISLRSSAAPRAFRAEGVGELRASLKTAEDFLHKAKGVVSSLIGAYFKAKISISDREELSDLSEAVEEFSLLKNSPEWMDIHTEISIRENFSFAKDVRKNVKTIFNKIKSLCPQGFLIIDSLTVRHSWNPYDLYCRNAWSCWQDDLY